MASLYGRSLFGLLSSQTAAWRSAFMRRAGQREVRVRRLDLHACVRARLESIEPSFMRQGPEWNPENLPLPSSFSSSCPPSSQETRYFSAEVAVSMPISKTGISMVLGSGIFPGCTVVAPRNAWCRGERCHTDVVIRGFGHNDQEYRPQTHDFLPTSCQLAHRALLPCENYDLLS